MLRNFNALSCVFRTHEVHYLHLCFKFSSYGDSSEVILEKVRLNSLWKIRAGAAGKKSDVSQQLVCGVLYDHS